MAHPRLRTTLAVLALLMAGFVAGRGCSQRAPGPGPEVPVAATEGVVWTCSMHPQVRLPGPGPCPICGMDLVPAEAEGEDTALPVLRMTAAAARLARIETESVRREHVSHEVRMVGKVDFDETRLAYLTAWVPGRLDRLFVDYTGVTVRRGDHLVEIYSPRLYAAQQELLQAIAAADKLGQSSLELLRTSADRTVESSREKLRLWGMQPAQVEALVERGTPDLHVTIQAPASGVVVDKNAVEGMYVEEGTRIFTIADLSKVWVMLDAYESDLAWLRYGQDVRFRVEAYPGETFHGRIAFIDPVLDDRTRTVKVRLNVENGDQRLKPDMFVSAQAHALLTTSGQVVDAELEGKWMCPMHPEVLADGPSDCPECGMALAPVAELGFVIEPRGEPSLVVPASAPLLTGERAVVYVEVSDDPPTYEGREVVLGPRAGDVYVVRSGLRAGERVVVQGNFKIDSELQIRARPSMMSAAGAGAAGAGGGPRGPRAESSPELRAHLGRVLEAYLRLQRALAADDDDGGAAAQVAGSARALPEGALDALRADLVGGAQALADAQGIDARRVAFAPLSDTLARMLEAVGYERAEGDVARYHCSMAFAGAGADWLQAGEPTANPYFGSAMPRCGLREDVLSQER